LSAFDREEVLSAMRDPAMETSAVYRQRDLLRENARRVARALRALAVGMAQYLDNNATTVRAYADELDPQIILKAGAPRIPRRFLRTFEPQFADLVEAGLKTRTIRKMPMRESYIPRPGDILDARMWTGAAYRSKMLKLGEYAISEVTKITIHENDTVTLYEANKRVLFEPAELDEFAEGDGFKNWFSMRDFFKRRHKLPFTGIMIDWEGPL
jgi:hypothetical protein